MQGDRRLPEDACPQQDAGFTLVEMMVVVLIIGILIAIALPTFFGAREKAEDKSAESDLRNGLAAALTYQAGKQDFNGFNVAAAFQQESGLKWEPAGTDPPPGHVTIQVALNDELLLVAQSQTGTYFCVSQLPSTPATDTGKGANFASVSTVAQCTGGW